MAFDTELEADLLAQCMRSTAFVKRALPVLRRHDFSDRTYAWIWKVIADCYGKSRELPTARIYSVRLARDVKDDDEHDYTIKALIALRGRRPKAPASALEEVRRFVRMAAARRAAFDALDNLDKHDVDAAVQALAEADRQTKAANVIRESTDWAQSVEERLVSYGGTVEHVTFPTPLRTINGLIGGGLRAGNVGIIVATTNVGKSTFAVDCGYSTLMRTDSVVIHIPTEETEQECAARYDARLTGIERSILLRGEATQEQQAHILRTFERRSSKIGNRLLIHGIEPGQSVAGIRAVAEQVREEHPDRPILVIGDSVDHLKPPDRMESHRLAQSGLYWYLLAMVHDETLAPIGAWSTVQAPAEYIRKQLNKAAASESQDKPRVASIMLGLDDRTEADEEDLIDPDEDTLELWLLKNRQERVNKRCIQVSANMGTCSFRELANQRTTEDD